MLKNGTQVGRYKVVAPIAGGAMGMVYRVRHLSLNKEMALKVLLPTLAFHNKGRKRFEQEAYVQSQLEHPHIVAVRDLLPAAGSMAMLMDLVEGPTLEAVLLEERQGPWSIDDTLSLMTPVLEAVDFAHAGKVIHRDLKPGNILLDRSDGAGGLGTPKVTDFGLAKILEKRAEMTRQGTRMGSIPYMAPEQFRGEKTGDVRADVFALGMLTWRLLAGHHPVRVDDQSAVYELYTGIRALPRLDSIRKRLPPHVVDAVAHATALDVADRTPTVRHFMAELKNEALSAPPQKRTAKTTLTPIEHKKASRKPASGRRVIGLFVVLFLVAVSALLGGQYFLDASRKAKAKSSEKSPKKTEENAQQSKTAKVPAERNEKKEAQVKTIRDRASQDATPKAAKLVPAADLPTDGEGDTRFRGPQKTPLTGRGRAARSAHRARERANQARRRTLHARIAKERAINRSDHASKPQRKRRALAHVRQGIEAMLKRDYERALQHLHMAKALDPQNPAPDNLIQQIAKIRPAQ